MSTPIQIQKTFNQLVDQRGKAQSRIDLDVYSTSQSSAAITAAVSGINLTPYALHSTVAATSAALTNNYTSLVNATSGTLFTDINNLDLSLTQKIQQDCVQSAGVSGSSTTVNGFVTVTINGTSFKFATIA